jgi:hypothetical protein
MDVGRRFDDKAEEQENDDGAKNSYVSMLGAFPGWENLLLPRVWDCVSSKCQFYVPSLPGFRNRS